MLWSLIPEWLTAHLLIKIKIGQSESAPDCLIIVMLNAHRSRMQLISDWMVGGGGGGVQGWVPLNSSSLHFDP